MFYSFSEEQLRAICKTSIESLEMWARRLIHDEMTRKFGDRFAYVQTNDGNFLVKKEIRQHITFMRSKEPSRFQRDVDTLFFEHIIYFLCNQRFYKELFHNALLRIYPQGIEEARLYLERLIPIRNALSHANTISIHQAERAVCYSHDFVEGIKEYYRERGLEKVWNVPRIVKVTDSLGNVFINEKDIGSASCDAIFTIPQKLYCGDTYSVEIEIDASFNPNDYQIKWVTRGEEIKQYENKMNFSISFSESDICVARQIECMTIQNKTWHKYRDADSVVSLLFTVLPNQ